MSFSISDFAEKAVMGTQASTPPQPVGDYIQEDTRDISNISVPDGFVQGIFEQTSPASPPVANTSLREMKTILIAVSRVLAEQTAVGSIGVGPATTKKKRKESSDELLKRIRTRRS